MYVSGHILGHHHTPVYYINIYHHICLAYFTVWQYTHQHRSMYKFSVCQHITLMYVSIFVSVCLAHECIMTVYISVYIQYASPCMCICERLISVYVIGYQHMLAYASPYARVRQCIMSIYINIYLKLMPKDYNSVH